MQSNTKASKKGNGLLIRDDLPGLIEKGHAALTNSRKRFAEVDRRIFPQTDSRQIHDAHADAERVHQRPTTPGHRGSVASAG